MRRRSEHGFTLIELLLVLALIGALIAFAWPDFSSATQAEQLKESAQRMRSLIAMCRAEAMNEARCYRIELRRDGSLRVRRQVDPILAPHLYNTVHGGWARTAVLLSDVWVEAVQLLPDGPPPILIVDEQLEFPEMEIEPVPIEEIEEPVAIEFEPDGSCPSLRWVLRDVRGGALLLTLDGRLGRVTVEEWESVLVDDVLRPEPLSEEEEEYYDPEDFR